MKLLTLKSLLACALVAFTMANVAQAQDQWKQYTTADGLPDNQIQMLELDDEGRLWIGTLKGLASFDGSEFTTHLKSGQIWDVLPADDQLLVGTQRGVVHLKPDGSSETAIKGSTVAPMLRVDEKTIWAVAKNQGSGANHIMTLSNNGAWTEFAAAKDEAVMDLHRASDGTVWATIEGNGLLAFSAENRAQPTRHLEGMNIGSVVEDKDGNLWVGTWGQGVAMYDGSTWHRHLPKEKSYIFAIRQSTDGTIWAATNANGLYRYDGSEWTNDLSDAGSISMLETTSDGKVWVSAGNLNGLRYWDGKDWKISLNTPLPIRGLVEGKDGTLYAGGILDGIYVKKP